MLRVPEELITRMRASPCLRLEVPLSARIDLLIEEYQHYLDDPRPIIEQLALLLPLRGRETVENWQSLAQAGNWPGLVAALLKEHYDPAYLRSLSNNYAARDDDWQFSASDLSCASLKKLAEKILAHSQAG